MSIRVPVPTTPKVKNLSELKPDTRLIFHNSGFSIFEFNGSELMFVRIEKNGDIAAKIIKSNYPQRYAEGEIIYPHIDYLYHFIPPKPHEYSPVFMTGRYRTVGD